MPCQQCKSVRILHIMGKTSDLFSMQMFDKSYEGYVPSNINIGGDDYIEFDYCLDCGQIQGNFPVTPEEFDDDLEQN